jgi:protein-tyrosine phosphatase
MTSPKKSRKLRIAERKPNHRDGSAYRAHGAMTKSVLFVCMGNICRSPAAEAVMKRFAEEFGIDVAVDSAGTHDYHVGKRPDQRMVVAAEGRGYELTSVGRQVTRDDLDPNQFDLVLAMDRDNYQALQRMAPKPNSHIRVFSDYLDDNWPNDVPDPYYGADDGFEQVLDMLEEGCPLILQTLMGEDIFAGEFDDE